MEEVNKSIKTTAKEIAEYWMENNNIDETKLNFDWSDALTNCWNCGEYKYSKSQKKTNLQRCHIIPKSLNGADTPDNYVLLCKKCHADAPNITNQIAMWDWIQSNFMPISFYGTYNIRKALILFKQKEGYSFFKKVANVSNINEILLSSLKSITNHEFDKINPTTYYYMLKDIVDKHSN